MVVYLVMASVLSAAPGQVSVQMLDGGRIGPLSALSRDQVVVGGETISVDKLVSIKNDAPSRSRVKALGVVELIDRSTLAILDYRVRGGTAHLTLAGGAEIDLPTRAIRWVRFQPPAERNEKLARQWADMLESKPAGDLLVVRKSGAIDYLEGKLGDVDEQSAKFTVDDAPASIPRQKIGGLVYFHATEPELPDALCKATDVHGTALVAQDVTLADGKLKISTAAGLKLEMPLDSFTFLDFAAGKIQYLSDLEPESARYVPYFELSKELASVNKFYAPRRDVSFDQAPLQLDGEKYKKGLSLASRTTVGYRLPGKFRLFKAVAGIDDSVRPGGNLRVQIRGDGKRLWESAVKGTEKAIPLELDVTGVKRLEILVDFGDDLDVADRFDLCEARVTK